MDELFEKVIADMEKDLSSLPDMFTDKDVDEQAKNESRRSNAREADSAMSQPLLAAARRKSREASIADSPELEKEGDEEEEMREARSNGGGSADQGRLNTEDGGHFDEDCRGIKATYRHRVPPAQRHKKLLDKAREDLEVKQAELEAAKEAFEKREMSLKIQVDKAKRAMEEAKREMEEAKRELEAKSEQLNAAKVKKETILSSSESEDSEEEVSRMKTKINEKKKLRAATQKKVNKKKETILSSSERNKKKESENQKLRPATRRKVRTKYNGCHHVNF